MYARNFWILSAIQCRLRIMDGMSDMSDMSNGSSDSIINRLQIALKTAGQELMIRADMAKRGRKPLPAWLRRRRVFVRLLLPEETEWLRMLKEAGHETQTEFFQEWVDVFLASRPTGRDFLKRASKGDHHKD